MSGFRHLAQRGTTSRADKMNHSNWFQFKSPYINKFRKKYQTRKRRQFLKNTDKI